jgi:glutamyl-Q tRNA(Asp) synthetase
LYRGRFAPSPTGPLHAGSLVAALASWLDAKAHQGQWLVRIEDVDTPRCTPGIDQLVLKQLADCGLHADEPPVWQSQRTSLYQQALDDLVARGLAYPCHCSRKAIETAWQAQGLAKPRHGELIYPGTCRSGVPAHLHSAWRLDVSRVTGTSVAKGLGDGNSASIETAWTDRHLGTQHQDVQQAVGDFVLKRADGLFAYQLAVVVDDAAQGITHVVRGQDLADNTARQIVLQKALGLPTPSYLHTPLVLGINGEKLSKQNGAQPIDTSDPLKTLADTGSTLGLQVQASDVNGWLIKAAAQWGHLIAQQPTRSWG